MQQLRMLWTNDGIPAKEPVLPSGLQVVNFTELNDAKNIWLDLVQYGLSSKREDESYYEKPWFIGRIISRTNAFFF